MQKVENEIFRLETNETLYVVTEETNAEEVEFHIHIYDASNTEQCIDKEFGRDIDDALETIKKWMRGEGVA